MPWFFYVVWRCWKHSGRITARWPDTKNRWVDTLKTLWFRLSKHCFQILLVRKRHKKCYYKMTLPILKRLSMPKRLKQLNSKEYLGRKWCWGIMYSKLKAYVQNFWHHLTTLNWRKFQAILTCRIVALPIQHPSIARASKAVFKIVRWKRGIIKNITR